MTFVEKEECDVTYLPQYRALKTFVTFISSIMAS